MLLRLVVGPLVGVGLASLFAFEGLARAVGVLQAAMPTGVSANLMAVEFSADADYVTNVTLFPTLLSAVSLSVVLGLAPS